jgi:predicted RNA-binding protein
MCEANAFLLKNGEEQLVMEAVDLLEPDQTGTFKLVNIFGEQKTVIGRLKTMNLVNHKIVFEE